MKWKAMWAGVALATVLSALPAAAQTAEGVAAIVNDSVISTYDVRQRATLLLASAGVQSTPEMQQRAREAALNNLIDEHLELQEAATFEIAISEDEIDRRLEAIARSNDTTREGFEQQLAQSGIGVATLRHQIKADIAWQRLMSGLYGSRVRVSSVEVQETRDRIAANATRPHFLVSEIFLPAESEEEFQQMQAGAMQLLEEIGRCRCFPQVARQFSAAPSAAQGGDIGWIAASEMTAEVAAVVQRLEPSQVSLPIRTPTGVYIVALRDRREGVVAGATSQVSLRQISAPAARRPQLERAQRRIETCSNLESAVSGVEGAEIVDLGSTTESELSEAIRTRIANVAPGRAAPVEAAGELVNTFVVCSRETGGGGVPTTDEIENRLYEQEMSMLSERYLRNLRREATIITR